MEGGVRCDGASFGKWGKARGSVLKLGMGMGSSGMRENVS